ncbi:hypothetical protein ACQUWM_09365 [Marinobacter sp. DUT-3]|uniref:hypothetical protein n=1 Tax=Marinobacter sp. DUT-3 TaxID=3412036 RepID=UPI003D18108C
MRAGNEPMATYVSGAYRRDAIPEQAPLKDISGFAKSLEAGDFIERLPWGDYANIDISVSPNSARIHQARMAGSSSRNLAGPAWTHKQQPTEFVKTRWQLLLMLAGAFADYGMLKFLLFCSVFADIATIIKFESYSVMTLVVLGLHLLFRYPFTWVLERYPGFIVKDLGCGFFRTTGMVKFRTWREETFEAPFIEFDPYISFHVNPKGPVSYKLLLRHRYTGWQTTVAQVADIHKVELYAHWDELQRYMDVSQPLPDVPALEKFRPLDPTTAEYDAADKRGRPADYWATLDLAWWEEEGYPAHLKAIREFPWSTLEDRMEKSVPNLVQGAMV